MDTSYLPFTEKYRPSKLQDICLTEYISNILEHDIEHNLLLYGPAGSGKTSVAKVLAKNNGVYLYLNASSDNSVEIVRNKIAAFCSSSALFDSGSGKAKKIVILDEFDYFTSNAFAALRASIEKYAMNTCFIATCNYPDRIPEPIRSRFYEISFDFSGDSSVYSKFFERLKTITVNEGYKITDEACALLMKKFFPDMRKCMTELQTLLAVKNHGETIEEDEVKKECCDFWIYEAVLDSDIEQKEIFETVMGRYVNNTQEILDMLGRPLIKYILDSRPEFTDKVPALTIIAGKYLFQYKQCYDKAICLLACIAEMRDILHH